MEENLDREIQKFFHFLDKDVNGKQHTNGRNMPRHNEGEDVQDDLDGAAKKGEKRRY